MDQKIKCLYAFGPFVVDSGRRLLLRDDNPVTLTPKTWDALLVLVESRGRMLYKDELMKSIWPDTIVDESNLTQQISMIRKALGESRGGDRYIVTVPGRGYRFAAEVQELNPGREQPRVASPERTAGAHAEHAAPSAPNRSNARWAMALTGVVLLAALPLAIRRLGSAQATPRSLAILPFQNLRDDPGSNFLGFSLADTIITRLGYISSLTVRPSSAVQRYRNRQIDIQAVAADLRVDVVLTGNFLRDGDDLRITSQLVEVKTQKILWRGAWDLKYDKLLTLQDSVAQQIIKGLALSLPPQEEARLRPEKPIDPLAYEYYLRGVDLYPRGEFPLAIAMLEKSAALEPNYAPTWAQLGRARTADASFHFGGRPQYAAAEAAYEKALALQPAELEAQIYLANLFTDIGRAEQAVPLLKKALSTNPNHAEAHWELGYAWRFAGILNESVTECERARQLDPGVKANTSALNAYLYLGEYDKFLQSLPPDNGSAFVAFYRGFGEYHKHMYDVAKRDFDHAFELDPSLLQAQVGKSISFQIQQESGKGMEILRAAEGRIQARGVGDPEAMYKIAQAYAVLGDKDSALRVLRRSVENGFFASPYISADPLLARLHGDPQFAQIMAVALKRHEAFRKVFF